MTATEKIFGALAAAILGFALLPCHAQDGVYPVRPVQIVVPFPPGGSADLVGRTLADKVGAAFGQQVVIINRPGAAGVIGTQSVAAAPPDGYTLALSSVGSLIIAPALATRRPYEVLTDFAPITLVAKVAEVTMASAKADIRSFPELIAVAKAHPGKLSYGSTGVGSIPHLATELLKKEGGIDMVHVPYTGGATSLSDLLTGRIEIMINDLPAYLPHIRSGALNALAVNGPQRSNLLPDVPTTAELGYPTIVSENWFGLLAPAQTPPAIVAKINRAFVAALADPSVKAALGRNGVAAVGQPVDDFRVFLGTEEKRWNAIIQAVHIQ
ncbi:MAG TPA: tripartite tricarboxylate transporter substrate binding protein [Xanthobacteraceae bacterium]|nr:tripartite tricarboxylate transporter substrate binding protein [Xanthobacteraceae bacterium]